MTHYSRWQLQSANLTFTWCRMTKKCPFDRWFDCALTRPTQVSSSPSFEALLLLLPTQNNGRGNVRGREASSLKSLLFILIALQPSFVLLSFSVLSSNVFTSAPRWWEAPYTHTVLGELQSLDTGIADTMCCWVLFFFFWNCERLHNPEIVYQTIAEMHTEDSGSRDQMFCFWAVGWSSVRSRHKFNYYHIRLYSEYFGNFFKSSNEIATVVPYYDIIHPSLSRWCVDFFFNITLHVLFFYSASCSASWLAVDQSPPCCVSNAFS